MTTEVSKEDDGDVKVTKVGDKPASHRDQKVMKMPGRTRKTKVVVYNLAYFNLWWRRMERDGVRDHINLVMETVRLKQSETMTNFLN